jgi:mRNA interferase MazF
MTNYEFGDLVLVPFPFTNQSESKKRPAVIISSETYHSERLDLILMAVTSQIKAPPMTGEVAIKDWQGAGLLKPSIIKPIIATVERTLILKKLGQLKEEEQSALREAIRQILG